MSKAAENLVVLFGGWGREQAVLRLLQAGFTVRAVLVPVSRSDKLNRSVDTLTSAGLTVVSCQRNELPERLREHEGSALVSVGFPYIVPPEVLSLFRICLNVHPTCLPQYRGPTTRPYILMNNEPESGSTVHIMDDRMDTGPIVLQRKVRLSKFDTVRTLRDKVYAIEPDLLVSALRLVNQPGFQPTPQDERLATTYPKKRTPDDSEIDPRKSLLELYDEIRACDPDDYPAFFRLEGRKVCVGVWFPDFDEGTG